MAVSLDTFDKEISYGRGGLHPMNKISPSQRLAVDGMNYTHYPTRGPWPHTVTLKEEESQIHISYDQPFTYYKDS